MSKTKEVRISGKVLAQINMPDFCPRCFWVKQKVKNLPYQIFPGIFSSIDAYTKKVMHAWFDNNKDAPPWLPELQGVIGYLKCLHWSKFKRLDPVTGITVSGAMDDLFAHEDDTHIIPDYKTAKFTANADKLFPLYEGQLNAYKWVHEGIQEKKVSSLLLIYCEPVTGTEDCVKDIYQEEGFYMGFKVKTIAVEMSDDLIPRLLATAKEILDMDLPPESADGCKDCIKLDNLIDTMVII